MQYFEGTLTQVLCCTAGLTSFCHEAAHQSCSVVQGWVRILSSHSHLPGAEQLLGPFIASLQNRDKPVMQLNLRWPQEKPPTKLWLPCSSGDVPGCPSLVRLLPGQSGPAPVPGLQGVGRNTCLLQPTPQGTCLQ